MEGVEAEEALNSTMEEEAEAYTHSHFTST